MKCRPTINQQNYCNFRLKLAKKNPKPRVCQIELTFKCNFNCGYCYLGAWRKKPLMMRFNLAKNIIDQLFDQRFLYISFTGGEPLLNPDFFKIFSYAKKRGFIITVLTNASLINERICQFFNSFPPFFLDISLNAVKASTFEKITRTPAALTKVLTGIEQLRKYAIPFKLKTKALNLNAKELNAIASFAKKINTPHSLNNLVHCCLDGDKTPSVYRLPTKTKSGIISTARREIFSCAAIRFSINIDPSGRLCACALLRQPSFDLTKYNLGQGLNKLETMLFDQTFQPDSACKNCRFFNDCQVCPGIAYIETVALDNPVDYLCKNPKVRFIKNAQPKTIATAYC
jgi:radical SAM protein with 4Fe4S-binding SPASM domain